MNVQGQLFDVLGMKADAILEASQPMPENRPPGVATVLLESVGMRMAGLVASARTLLEAQQPGWKRSMVQGDCEPEAAQDRHLHACCAELAVASRLNVHWQCVVNGQDGDEYDLRSPAGQRIEVKSTRHAGGLLLVKAEQIVGRPRRCDVFVHVITKWLPHVIITGSALYSTLIDERNVRADLRGAYCLPQTKLIRKLPK